MIDRKMIAVAPVLALLAGACLSRTEPPAGGPLPERTCVAVREPKAQADTDPARGAVAVMPTEPLSVFFPSDDPAFLGRCEEVIAAAIESDSRLKMVDRTNLAKVLQEQKLALTGFEPAPAGQIVAADLIVLSHTITIDNVPCLRIQAYHAPTACLLSELRFAVKSADEKEFLPRLAKAVVDWWPTVLQRLNSVRTKPVWFLSDVQIGLRELCRAGEQAQVALQADLAANERVFCVEQSSLTEAQLEMFLKLGGFSKPMRCSYTSAADYVLESRLCASDRMELAIRDGGSLAMIEKTAVTGAKFEDLLSAAKKWVRQAAGRLSRPSASQPHLDDARYNEWARQQARLEYEQGRLIYQEDFRLRYPYNGWGGKPIPPQVQVVLDHLQTRYVRHFRRAGQLDPTWEEAAYEAAKTYHASFGPVDRDVEATTILHVYKRGSEVMWQFLQQFPRSAHHEAILTCAFSDSSTVFRVAVRPAGLSEQEFHKVREFYLRRALECSLEFAERYDLHKAATHTQFGFNEHLGVVSKYLEFTRRSDEELQWLVAEWSRRFDAHPESASHSDFVRLLVLAHKGDKKGYRTLLADLQQRWPDPRHFQWTSAGDVVNSSLVKLFGDSGTFWPWYRHRWDKDEPAAAPVH